MEKLIAICITKKRSRATKAHHKTVQHAIERTTVYLQGKMGLDKTRCECEFDFSSIIDNFSMRTRAPCSYLEVSSCTRCYVRLLNSTP